MAEVKQTKVCPKCSKQMEEGYIPDRGNNNSAAKVSVWVSGQPQKGFFGGIGLDGKTTWDVIAFRCIACGFLESYAQE